MLRSTLLRHALPGALTLSLGLVMSACPDDGKRPLGASCDSNSDCASGLCAGGQCLDPDADEDLDGLTNGIEAQLGSNPFSNDTDSDEILDGDEVQAATNVDTDGDTLADIVESATADADADCIPDQYDARNDVADSDLSPMIAVVCQELGICQGQRAAMQVECSTGTARCVYDAVPGFEDPETQCDGVDQNCDGVADDGFPDRDGDGDADCVDIDWDNDAAADLVDNCPATANPDQADSDGDGIGNACVAEYGLTFIEGPGEIVAGVPFSVSVAIRALAGVEVPLPVFRGNVTISLGAGAGVDLAGTLTQPAGEDGVVVFDDLVIDGPAEGLVLVADSGDLGQGTSPEFTAAAGEATELAVEGLPASTVAGEPFSFEVVALDSFGNVFDSFDGTISFASSDPDATLPASYTFTAADAGRKTFDGAVLRLAGEQTITVTSGGISGDATIDVTAADFDALLVEVADSVVAGQDLAFVVIAGDAFGNPVPSYAQTLTVATTDELAEVPDPLAPSAADPGRYTSSVSGGVAGTHTLTITAGNGDTVEASYEVVAGDAVTLELVAPASIGAGIPFNATVTARDVMGNAAAGFTGTVTLASSDVRATLPAAHTYVAADAGAHTFEGVALFEALGQTLTAMSGDLTDTVEINVIAGDVAALVITEAPATVAAGAAFSLAAELRDAAGNLAADDARTIVVTVGAEQIATVSATTSAVALSDLVITTAGTITVTVTASELGLSDTVDIVVTPLPATHLSITGPAAAAAGTPFDVTVSARDQYENVAAGYRGTVVFTTSDESTDPAPVLPADYTFSEADQGSHTFTAGVTLQTASATPTTVTVTDQTPLADATAVLSVSVGGGDPARIEITAPATAVSGIPFAVTVTAYDDNGNIANGYRGTVAFTSEDAGATLPADYTFTAQDAGRHVFTGGVTLLAVGAIDVTATDQTPLATPADTATVNVTAGAPATFEITRDGEGSLAAGAPFDVSVTARDELGNVVTTYTGQIAFSVDVRPEDPAAVLPAAYTFVAGDAGVKTFTDLQLFAAGDRTVTVTEQGAADPASGELMVTVTALDVSALRFGQQPLDGTAGTAFSSPVTVRTTDAYGNVIAIDGAPIELSLGANPGRAVLGGNPTAITSAGVATFPAITVDRPGEGYTLVATSSLYTMDESDSFDMAMPAPVVGTPSVATDGACATVSYQASHAVGLPLQVRVEYNLANDTPDAGWLVATQCGVSTTGAGAPVGVSGLRATAAPQTYKFRWNALRDLGGFDATAVSVRVSAAIDGQSATSTTTNYTYDASWTGQWTPSIHAGDPVDSAVADLDLDGIPDLVTIEANSNAFSFHRGLGDGKFDAVVEIDLPVDGMNGSRLVVTPLRISWAGTYALPDVLIADAAENRLVIASLALSPDNGLPYAQYDMSIYTPCELGEVRDIAVGRIDDPVSRVQVWVSCPDADQVVSYIWSGQLWDVNDTIDTSTYGTPTVLESADLDFNGQADLVIGLETGGAVLYGAPSYFQTVDATGLDQIVDIAIGDLDRDGFQDIVLADDEAVAPRVFAVFGNVTRSGAGIPTQLVDPASVRAITTRGAPSALDLGDVDHDGWLEVVLGYRATDSVGVLRARNFRSGATIEDVVVTGATTEGASSVAVSDLNLDGWLDIALARDTGAGSEHIGAVLTNARADCDFTWSGGGEATVFGHETYSDAVVADVDGDARLDLVYALGGFDEGGVAVVYGLGNGRFVTDYDVLYTSGLVTNGLSLADYNGDGKTDIAAIDGNVIRVFTQLSRGNWVELTNLGTISTASGPLVMTLIDEDRLPDLAWLRVDAESGTSRIYVYRQLPGGSLTATTAGGITVGTFASGLTLGDLNDDGTPDLVFATHRPGTAFWSLCTLLSLSPTSWMTALDATNCAPLQDGNQDLALSALSGLVDVDEDGDLDVVLEIDGGNAADTIQVRHASAVGLFDVVEDDGSTQTTPAGYQFCGGAARSPVFGRFGGPGGNGLDVAVRCATAPAARTYDRLAGSYNLTPRATLGDQTPSRLLEVADFNGDQRQDLLLDTTVFERASQPTAYVYGAPTANSTKVTMADMDGNGFMDVVAISDEDEQIYVTRQTAVTGGTFLVPRAIAFTPDLLSAPAIGDIDGDGRNDFAVAASSTVLDSGPSVALFVQDAFAGISYERDDLIPQYTLESATPFVADFDDNGLDDVAQLVFGEQLGQYRIQFFLQYQPSSFETTESEPAGYEANDLAFGRVLAPIAGTTTRSRGVAIAGDCKEGLSPCIVLVDLDTSCDGPCYPRTILPDNDDPISHIAVGDLDRNGRDDIAIVQTSNSTRYASFFLQSVDGDYVQESMTIRGSPQFHGELVGIEMADVDLDGWLDLVAVVRDLRDDYYFYAAEVVMNDSTGDTFAMRRETVLEGLGNRLDAWFVGDLLRTGRPVLGTASGDGDLLRFKR